MSRPIDLMPESCRITLSRRERARRWTFIYSGVIVILLGGAWLLLDAQNAKVARRDALSSQVKEAWDRNEEAQGLLRQIQELDEAITRYNRLAWPVRVSDVVDIVAEVMSPQLTLTSLSMTPREESAKGRSARDKTDGDSDGRPRTLLMVEMEGLSPSDTELAQFVSSLDGRGLFSNITLDYARSTVIRNVEARSFRVTCTVNLSARFQFVTADPSPAAEPTTP